MSHPACGICLAVSGVFVSESGPDGHDRTVCKDAVECLRRRLAFLRLSEGEIGLSEFLTAHPSCEGFEGYRVIYGQVYNDSGPVPRPS